LRPRSNHDLESGLHLVIALVRYFQMAERVNVVKNRFILLCLLVIFTGCGLCVSSVSAGVKIVPTSLTGEEAAQHVQETNTVCGLVASTRYVETSATKPTYLNFDQPYPQQTFTAVIAESARAKFKEAPDVTCKGKNICVTGLITVNSHGKAQMMIVDPSQIVFQDTAPPATNQMDAATGK
jgi:hypothetical protein